MNFKLKLTALAVGITLLISCSKDDSLEEHNTTNLTIASKQRSNNLGSEHYNSGELTNLNNSKWMSALPDSKKIGDISIPGTHETFALYGRLGADLYVQCQSMSIEEQLKAGIRFIDARCRFLKEGTFSIHHGAFFQKKFFGEVIMALKKFLKNNPDETIFMRGKQEYSTESDENFIKVFNDYYKRFGGDDYFFAPEDPNSCNLPEDLGEVIEKIVIIENVSGLQGVKWNCLRIQDDYKLNLFSSTHSKYKKVEKHLEASNKDKENIYLNFSSATGWLFPYVIADDVNEYLLDYLKVNPTIKTGIVAMDYPGDDLIQTIINTNF